MLTEDQIRQFHTEGYLFLPETFSVEEVACLRADAEAIYAQERPEVWRERSGAPRTAFAAHLYNEGFGLLARHPAMIKPIPISTAPVKGSPSSSFAAARA